MQHGLDSLGGRVGHWSLLMFVGHIDPVYVVWRCSGVDVAIDIQKGILVVRPAPTASPWTVETA